MRQPGPGAGADSAAARRPVPSPRVTLAAWGAALLWAAALPELLGRLLAHRPAQGAAALLWSPAPHTAVAAVFLGLMLLRQGRRYRPWQSALLIALCASYLLGCAMLVAVA
jgi:hypothetical protein